MRLFVSAVTKFCMGILLVGAMLFLPAGSFDYFHEWLFLGLLFIPILLMGVVLFFKAPDLLQKRLQSKEKSGTQRGVVAIAGLMFVVGFVVAGLDFRFGWSHVPGWVVWSAGVILLAAYLMYAEVMRENAYLSRVIEVQDDQKVIDTGLYALVRHPMYLATVLLFLAIPIVLGSWLSLLCFLPYVPLIVIRIKDEETILSKELAGYADYCRRVRYRLIPFVW